MEEQNNTAGTPQEKTSSVPVAHASKEPSSKQSFVEKIGTKTKLSLQQLAQIKEFSKHEEEDPMIATQGGLQRHRAEASRHLSHTGKRFFELIEFDEDEKLLLEVRKHPWGLVVVWLVGIIVTVILVCSPVIVAAFLSSSNDIVSTGDVSTIQGILFVLAVLLGIGGIAVTFINSILYKNNVIFVTSEKLAQVLYISLFHRKISQLSIGDLQDVTVRQDGIFPRIFNYGTLTIETSGEQMNYVFTYVPAPYESARLIVGSHEENLKNYGN